MKKRKDILTAVFCLCMLLCGCAETEPAEIQPVAPVVWLGDMTPTPAPTAVPVPESIEDTLLPGVYHAAVPYEEMQWYRYDMAEFDARIGELLSAAAGEEAVEAYDWLYAQLAEIATLDQLAWIAYYADTGDERLYEACQWTDEVYAAAYDSLCAALAQALSGPCGEVLASHIGPGAEVLAEYSTMSEREEELWARETELCLDYNQLMSREDLSEPELNAKTGAIFLELVAIRGEIAELGGYDNFVDYAYENYYARDYTPEDAAVLCGRIKPLAQKYFENCCYSSVFYDSLGPEEIFTAQELLDLLETYTARLSPQMTEALEYMRTYGLYMLEDSHTITDMGFTTTLPSYGAPFLYNSLYGNIYDVGTIIHEFGHYYDAYCTPQPNLLTDAGSYDIFEIHSTGLEALFYDWYDEIFPTKSDAARIHCLDGLMYNVISGCIFDEFQQYVYTHPDMTVDEVNQAYARICESYGYPMWSQSSYYYWMYVTHNFESPLYYISYAASSLASLQLWGIAREEPERAARLYLELVSRGAYDIGYCELLQEIGLSVFTQDLGACVDTAYAQLEEMCLRYDSQSARPAA